MPADKHGRSDTCSCSPQWLCLRKPLARCIEHGVHLGLAVLYTDGVTTWESDRRVVNAGAAAATCTHLCWH
jgi:hypothetical protein